MSDSSPSPRSADQPLTAWQSYVELWRGAFTMPSALDRFVIRVGILLFHGGLLLIAYNMIQVIRHVF